MPWVEISSTGQQQDVLADRSLIIKGLIEKVILHDINAALGVREKAQDFAIRYMLEEKLSFYNTRERWIDNYYMMRDFSLASILFPLCVVIGYPAYRGATRKLHDQGTGRFTDDEIRYFRRQVWASVDEKCFWVLGGDEPTEADATVYGFIVSALVSTAGPESTKIIKADFPVVVEYATRIHNRYFPEYEMWP